MSQQHARIQLIPDGEEPVLYINPRSTQIASLTEELTAAEDHPEIHLLAESNEIKDALNNFITASNIAELVEQDRLNIRTLTDPVQNTILATKSEIVVPLMGGHSVSSSDRDLSSSLYSEFKSRFEDAESYRLRTPAISKVKQTFREDIGDDIADDLDEVLSNADEISNTTGYLDIIEVTLLLAARNEVLLYDISKWGEDVGIASKATYSRTKSALEDAGLIDTEKVPIDIGRPRLRLIASDQITNADLKTLSSEITSQM